MNVELFDYHTGGHHLEFCRKHLNFLNNKEKINAHVVTLGHDKRYDEFFQDKEVKYLDTEHKSFYNKITNNLDNPRLIKLEVLKHHLNSRNIDVVHLMQIDDILNELYTVFSDHNLDTRIIGSINGAFFSSRTTVGKVVSEMYKYSLPTILLNMIPPRGRDPAMYHCLNNKLLDAVFVPTSGGNRYLKNRFPVKKNKIVTVPDPVEPWYTENMSQIEARRNLNLPENDQLLLFFGELRESKGINELLDAISGYSGPEFSLVIVGSPVDVTEEEIITACQDGSVNCIHRLEFIPEADVKDYFISADRIILPYQSEVGDYQPSNVFQKSCAARRPVIAPDRGFFQNRMNQIDSGISVKPMSPENIRSAIKDWLTHRDDNISKNVITEYVNNQSFERWSEIMYQKYIGLQ
ncbi:glycosyltransferase [Halorubrum ezzemoulense]|uniref:glycosyltransferase n=1 Tax=Halorubrum ezzemoulense TaxID=337243 RepID=UPI002330B537|nr:glycosyltransferase [Halorubrum ezzemoulense]MDB9281721.1 glycosyltransferase [Halorubrum ezzemoulense]MDB9285243.1 glycosyltransferase [Halorubrum ezzemoulense]